MTEPQIDALGDMANGLDWLQKYVQPAMIQLEVSKDRAIGEALAAIQPLWTSDEISRRCVFMRCVGREESTLFVDGRAVMIFYPGETTQEWKEDRLIVTHIQRFKRIQAVKVANDG